MIELWQYEPVFGLMSGSPFCMKVEVFLRLAGLPYRCVDGMLPMKMPKGKLPVIKDGGHVVPDSQAIVVHLQQRYADRMPAAVAAPETGPQRALRIMLEEHTYFVMAWWRWIDDSSWAVVRQAYFGKLPPVIRTLVPALARRKIRRDMLGQGVGLHSPEEIAQRGIQDLDAIADILSGQPYFGGAQPAAIDASAYAFLANGLWVPLDNAALRHARNQPALVAYAERMKARVGLKPLLEEQQCQRVA